MELLNCHLRRRYNLIYKVRDKIKGNNTVFGSKSNLTIPIKKLNLPLRMNSYEKSPQSKLKSIFTTKPDDFLFLAN